MQAEKKERRQNKKKTQRRYTILFQFMCLFIHKSPLFLEKSWLWVDGGGRVHWWESQQRLFKELQRIFGSTGAVLLH